MVKLYCSLVFYNFFCCLIFLNFFLIKMFHLSLKTSLTKEYTKTKLLFFLTVCKQTNETKKKNITLNDTTHLHTQFFCLNLLIFLNGSAILNNNTIFSFQFQIISAKFSNASNVFRNIYLTGCWYDFIGKRCNCCCWL